MEYRANFLWGYPDDSIESLGYEFANGKTEAYQKECWDALVQKIKEGCSEKILKEETAKDLPVCSSCGMPLQKALDGDLVCRQIRISA